MNKYTFTWILNKQILTNKKKDEDLWRKKGEEEKKRTIRIGIQSYARDNHRIVCNQTNTTATTKKRRIMTRHRNRKEKKYSTHEKRIETVPRTAPIS